MSGSGSEEADVTDGQVFFTREYTYLAYLSLGFKFFMTVLIVLMAGCVFYTIKSTRKLHKPHNIFVANLMVVDILAALLLTLPSAIMMIGFAAEIEDFVSCNTKQFLLFPIIAVHFTTLVIGVDKVIGITFPFKYKGMMTPYLVASMVAIPWLLAILFSVKTLFNVNQYVKNAKFGLCISTGSAFIELFLTHILPMTIASLLAMVFNIYLTIRAYQVRKQIEKETRLSGVTSKVKALKQKQHTIKKHLKPIVTLLVIMFGGSFIAFLFLLLVIPVRLLWHHENVIEYM